MAESENTRVLYQCSCGHQMELIEDIGGQCQECGHVVSPKLLNHDLATTMTLGTLPTGPACGGTLYFENSKLETDPVEAAKLEAAMVGREFGHFKIIDPLGTGGMGHVFRALDTSLRRYVAVKILRSGVDATKESSSDGDIEMLLQEAVSQARVTHPNIVTIYYVGKHEEAPFLAMELIIGKTVAELVEDGPMPYSQLHSIASQMTSALKFSHELDIIHGDIKPSNIMLQQNGIAKLSDFGMARRVSKAEKKSVGGTPNYLAPELMQGDTPSIQSDMYALGVTLFEMTFGRLPVTVSGRTVEQWLDCHQQAPVEFPNPWPEHLAKGWQEVLSRLLAKDPADRFSSWAAVEEALEQIEPAAPIPAKRVPRLVAAAIDCTLVGLLIAPFQILRGMPAVEEYLSQSTLTAIILLLFEFGAIVAYTTLVMFWKQSPGRKLMHVRVVNEHGLTVTGQRMGTRSLMRMIVMWFITLANVSSETGGWADFAANLVLTSAVVFTLLDIGVMMLYHHGRSLHDLVSKTWVVLDTE
ncbi:protein kinase domain-containing protein [Mariniblastus fucicola]|uniref:Serine/threonine-protein kinase PrkC n=1 Tax=Mariniblastus fucicola TaxID=980251 RepID=A0A5B9PF95_9BACT|nr:protein kinase [Mariniblastus fucicola]QEG23306.1 Serine/threonine-protein kinase PrkC [Mariniblastus fucicola]